MDLHPQDFDGWLRQQAETLPRLHALPARGYPWKYSPYNDLETLIVPGWAAAPRRWERLIELVQEPWPELTKSFIHRDYHPVNLLFEQGRLSGIVDWPNACLGPSGFDAAWCRRNLVQLSGLEAANRFLQHYQRAAGPACPWHPFIDLLALLEELPGPPQIYPPWLEYGVRDLSVPLIQQRIETYLAYTLAELG